ncbi:MAG: hypothetical protein M3Z04_14895, partial [Chloroflexota bacterium]|nr:hypothetical protein [Chloroflexota bacterium]
MSGQPQQAPTAAMRSEFGMPPAQPPNAGGSLNFFGTTITGPVIAGDQIITTNIGQVIGRDQIIMTGDSAARAEADYLFAVADVYSYWRNQYILGPASSPASPFIPTDSAALVRRFTG